jgi:hypothetical protein
MSTHQTAALKALFLLYTKKGSPTGEYYFFKILTLPDGETDFCRMDAIHTGRVPWLFAALDEGKPIYAPVIKDLKAGYRIDLTALDQFDPAKTGIPAGSVALPVAKPKSVTSAAKTRIQINIEPAKYEALCKLAEAEGFKSHSDWLRAVIDRVLDAAGA